MNHPQPGIFALGTASHAYLELDASNSSLRRELVRTIASLREPRTTMEGVNLVAGFRPELWREVAGDDAPAGPKGFDAPLAGAEGFVMPATQQDEDQVEEELERRDALDRVLGGGAAHGSDCGPGFRLRASGSPRGTHSPAVIDAPELAVIPEGEPGAGGTVLLLQKWAHDASLWEALSDGDQELVIGRRKTDSVELENKPADSHVASTDQDRFGKIFRRNMPYGTVTDHGTMFVGFSAAQSRLADMLVSMAGSASAPRDALTRYSRPLTGAYYFVPSIEALAALAAADQRALNDQRALTT